MTKWILTFMGVALFLAGCGCPPQPIPVGTIVIVDRPGPYWSCKAKVIECHGRKHVIGVVCKDRPILEVMETEIHAE